MGPTRRTVLSAAAGLGASLSIGGCLRIGVPRTTNRPSHHGDERWRFETSGSVTSPAVSGKTVYVSSGDGAVYAVDAESGELRWESETDQDPSSPAVAELPSSTDGSGESTGGAIVLVGIGGDRLRALDAGTGEQRWQFETGRSLSSPAVVHDVGDGSPNGPESALVVVGTDSSRGGMVHGLDAATGQRHWRFRTFGWNGATPWSGDESIYLDGGDGHVYALDAQQDRDKGSRTDGDERWRFEIGGAIRGLDVAVGTVFVRDHDRVYALDATSGRERWTHDPPGDRVISVTVADGTAFVATAENDPLAYLPSRIRALDVTTGDRQWAFETDFEILGPLVVADSVLYAGGSDRGIHALDAGTGDEQWFFGTGTPVRTAPAIVGESIYLGGGDTLYALDATPEYDEGFHWNWRLGDQWQYETEGPIRSSPTVVDGTVFVGGGPNPDPSVAEHRMYALDANREGDQWRLGPGDEQWVATTGARIWSSPAVRDGTVFVGSDDHNVYAFGGDGGEQQWCFETGDAVRSSPTVRDGTVFVGSGDGTVYAIDAETGERRWTHGTGDRVTSSPAVVDGTVFVGSNDHRLYALDADTGDREWQFATGDVVESSPTVATVSSGSADASSPVVFVGSYDRRVYALDAATGEQHWQFETGAPVASSPTVRHDTLFVGGGAVFALDAATGEETWRFETPDYVYSSPTVVGGTVFVGGRHLQALDADTGTQRWRFETAGRVDSSPTVVGGTLFAGGNDRRVYALETGVEGSSEGTRTMLGTLGHHDR